jgi:hypothetical protein
VRRGGAAAAVVAGAAIAVVGVWVVALISWVVEDK